MIPVLVFASLVATSPAPTCFEADALLLEPGPPLLEPGPLLLESDDELRRLYERGRTFHEFRTEAIRRKELWDRNWERSLTIDPELVRRARAVGGSWRLLAVAADGCSDSVSTIPYMARLAAVVNGLQMRIVDWQAGQAIMESHPTPDGRAATPTVVLLDEDWNEAGCFVERPPELRDWILENPEGLDREALYEAKMEWYDEDAGRQTVETVVRMLEAAARGERVCGR